MKSIPVSSFSSGRGRPRKEKMIEESMKNEFNSRKMGLEVLANNLCDSFDDDYEFSDDFSDEEYQKGEKSKAELDG